VDPAVPLSPMYPATLAVDPPERIARWRPLVHWLLVIPHAIVLYVIGIVSYVVAIISWFAILFTGKLPEGLSGLQCLYLRYNNRVQVFGGFLREEYPPFTFETTGHDPGDDPGVHVELIPALDGRNRLTTGFRFILVIPHVIALFFIGIAAGFAWLVAFFAVLFTANWPDGLRNFVVGYMRWVTRVGAYYLLLTDDYPPFSLD
jgi:Domain of unknown function (DUF4389)